jgi:hypothetical protein
MWFEHPADQPSPVPDMQFADPDDVFGQFCAGRVADVV